MIHYSRLKISYLYTLKSKLIENSTIYSGTYLYSPYMAVPNPLPAGAIPNSTQWHVLSQINHTL